VNIIVRYDQSTSSLPNGFVSAVNYVVSYYDSLFTSNVTINLDVGYGEIDGQPLESDAQFFCFIPTRWGAVPGDHPVREIAAVLDLSWMHSQLAPFYPKIGRPSIGPDHQFRIDIDRRSTDLAIIRLQSLAHVSKRRRHKAMDTSEQVVRRNALIERKLTEQTCLITPPTHHPRPSRPQPMESGQSLFAVLAATTSRPIC